MVLDLETLQDRPGCDHDGQGQDDQRERPSRMSMIALEDQYRPSAAEIGRGRRRGRGPRKSTRSRAHEESQRTSAVLSAIDDPRQQIPAEIDPCPSQNTPSEPTVPSGWNQHMYSKELDASGSKEVICSGGKDRHDHQTQSPQRARRSSPSGCFLAIASARFASSVDGGGE